MSASRRDAMKIEVDTPDCLMTMRQCIKLSRFMGTQSNTLQTTTIAHSRKHKVETQYPELVDHNYSANIESTDYLKCSNSSNWIGMLKTCT